MKGVVIVGAARTPFGTFGGVLKDLNVIELGAAVVEAVIKRANINGADIDEVYFGKNMPGSERSIARQVTLKAGLPDTVSSTTVDKTCSSAATAFAIERSKQAK